MRSRASVLIGLGIPAVAVLVGVPLVSDTSVSVLGIPLLFFWMFCCFPLTTACLWVSWRFFDSRYTDSPHDPTNTDPLSTPDRSEEDR